MSVRYDYYKIFYYVAKYRNITAAANALFLSQPTVSRTIQNLETELGCQLFIRSKKGVVLTPEGEILYRYVSRAHRSITQAEEALTEARSLNKGVLRIAATEMTMQNFLMPYLKRYHSLYPSIKLEISNGTTSEGLLMLGSNLADLAVITSPIPENDQLLVQKLRPINDVCIAGKQYEHLKERPLSLADLGQYPLICLKKGLTTRIFLDHVFESCGLLLDPDIEIASSELITPMVVLNMGIGIVPLRVARPEIEKGNVFCLSIKEKFPPRDLCLVSHVDYPPSAAARKFEDLLLDDSISE